jgi:hypothetical protein
MDTVCGDRIHFFWMRSVFLFLVHTPAPGDKWSCAPRIGPVLSSSLLYISIVERVPKIRANAQQADLRFVVPPLEYIFHEAAFREGRKKKQRRLSSPGVIATEPQKA